MPYESFLHPPGCLCCGSGIELASNDWQSLLYYPGQTSLDDFGVPNLGYVDPQTVLGSDANVTIVSESEIFSRRDEMGLSNSDWNYVSSLFPDNANVFFKWVNWHCAKLDI